MKRSARVVFASIALLAGASLVLATSARSADEDPQPKTYAELKDVMWTMHQGPGSVFAQLRDQFNKGLAEEDDQAIAKGRATMLCEVTNWMLKTKPPVNGDTPEGLAKWKKHVAAYRADAEAARDAATKKDAEAGKKALASLGKRCTECHDDHRKEE